MLISRKKTMLRAYRDSVRDLYIYARMLTGEKKKALELIKRAYREMIANDNCGTDFKDFALNCRATIIRLANASGGNDELTEQMGVLDLPLVEMTMDDIAQAERYHLTDEEIETLFAEIIKMED